jgi:hypothetical protein
MPYAVIVPDRETTPAVKFPQKSSILGVLRTDNDSSHDIKQSIQADPIQVPSFVLFGGIQCWLLH